MGFVASLALPTAYTLMELVPLRRAGTVLGSAQLHSPSSAKPPIFCDIFDELSFPISRKKYGRVLKCNQ